MGHREYRRLGIADLDLALAMEGSFRSNIVCRGGLNQFLLNRMNWIYACIEDNQIIGFAYGYELNRLDNKGNMMYIHEVSVLDKYQRQGIASTILNHLKTACRLIGICRIFLITQKHNKPAIALYENMGGERSDGGTGEDVVFFFDTKSQIVNFERR